MAWTQDRDRGSVGSLKPKVDSDGKIWLYGYTATGATRKTLTSIQLGRYGWTETNIADTSDVQLLQYIASPKSTYTSGVYGWFQIGGQVSDAIMTTTTATVGQGVKLATDTIVSTGAAVTGNDNIFAVFTTAKATSTTFDIILFPEQIDGAD
jgi:hypothetical protein